MADEGNSKSASSILGLSTEQLAGLSAEDLTNNPVAITMLLHYYRKLVDDNTSLRNNNNTLRTYVSAYERYRSSSAVGAILLVANNVSIGFGVNLLTSGVKAQGIASLVSGLAMAAAGTYLKFRKG